MEIEPSGATIGAVARGVRITELDDVTWGDLYARWLEYSVLVIPGQFLTRDEQVAFAKRFGPLEFDIIPISNIKADGTLYTPEADPDMYMLIQASHVWHTDSSYQPIHAKGAVFSGEIIPPGGSRTGFADMTAAYEALDPATRARVDCLDAYHSFTEKQARKGLKVTEATGVEVLKGSREIDAPYTDGERRRRPLVKTHPETGRKSLLLGDHIVAIEGMAQAEAEVLVAELTAFACQPPRIFEHEWSAGDVILWDNRCLLHRVLPWDLSVPRRMWHSRIAGDPATESELA